MASTRFMGGIIAAALVGCTGELPGGIQVNGAPPTASITWPTGEEAVLEGESVVLQGSLGDPDDPVAELKGTWLLRGQTVCEDLSPDDSGDVSCEVVFPAGESEIVLIAKDPSGLTGTDERTLSVIPTSPPVVEIQALEADALYAGTPFLVSAQLADEEDPEQDLEVWWESSLEGRLLVEPVIDDAGVATTTLTLGEGSHTLTLYARDRHGKTGTDTLDVQVAPPNEAPSCQIVSPQDASTLSLLDSPSLELLVSDAEQSADSLTVSVEGSVDGLISDTSPDAEGQLQISLATVSSGEQTFTVTVTDELGRECQSQTTLTLGYPPSVSVTLEEEVVRPEATIVPEVELTDLDDDAGDLTVLWTSSLEGEIAQGVGAELSLTTLGQHTLTATVTDSMGFEAQSSVVVTVNGAPAAPSGFLEPSEALTTDSLVLALAEIELDPEADPTTLSYAWQRDGTLVAGFLDTLPPSETAKGQTWTLTVFASDPYGPGASTVFQSTIVNSPPIVGAAEISPSVPQIGDTLSCEAVGITDADEDPTTPSIQWLVNGSTAGNGPELLGGFESGDTVTCSITAGDGEAVSEPATAQVTVGNSAPSFTGEATMSPDSLTVDSIPTCSAEGFEDPDGDLDQSFVRWSVNGSEVGVGAELPVSVSRGDTVSCEVVPFDGELEGPGLAVSRVVENSLPVLEGVALSPEDPTVLTPLLCEPTGSQDSDGDAVSVSVSWTVDGNEIGTSNELASGFVRGDEVICALTPDDGLSLGATLTESVVIGNAIPEADGLILTPEAPDTTSTLSCEVDGFVDGDGDLLQSEVEWFINGSPAGTGQTLEEVAVRGDTVRCELTLNDGLEDGETLSAEVEIGDAPPVISSVSLTPTTVFTSSVVNAVVEASDPDGDSWTAQAVWTVSGSSAGSSALSLGPQFTTRGDTVSAQITVVANGLSSAPVNSETVSVVNSPPSIPLVSLSPSDPVAGQASVVCGILNPGADADGDPLSYTIEWTGPGGVSPAFTDSVVFSGDTLPSTEALAEEVWTCSVQSDDTLAQSPVGSASVTFLGEPIGYGQIQFPCSGSAAAGSDFTAYGWVFVQNVTQGFGQGPGITAEIGVGPEGEPPETSVEWDWTAAVYNTDTDGLFAGDRANDEYEGTVTLPDDPGLYEVAFRFSTDSGLSWTVVDLGGSNCGGDGTNDGYDSSTALLVDVF